MDKPIDIHPLIASKQPKVGGVFFIAIDGHGGSGKSTVAKALSERLGAEIIHTDDFASWNNPFNWWQQIIEHVFEPIKRGTTTLSYPRSQWWENHRPSPVIDQPVTKIMILEGVSALRKEFREYISIGIFVDTPKDVCLRRGVERDSETGKSTQVLTEMWNEWSDEEDEYIKRDNPKEFANMVIDGTKKLAEQMRL